VGVKAWRQVEEGIEWHGTVDETTHAFSPKVLDRAFTIEMTEVDFENYPPPSGSDFPGADQQALTEVLLPDLNRGGRFAVIDKNEIAAFVDAHDVYRVHLQRLNARLQPFDLHFGYRVFDEIMAFLENVKGSILAEGFDGLDDAFDTAVLMKVLPKFHGPKGRLLEPLCAVLAWARDSDDVGAVKNEFQDAGACRGLRRALDARLAGQSIDPPADHYIYPRTALKAVRMLSQLHTTGFASFA
jgi:5-methylcytosine-specific restriction protein B